MNVRRPWVVLLGLLGCTSAGGCMDRAHARAGADQTVAAGEIVTLDGSRSLPHDEHRIDYLWQVVDGPAVTIADQKAAVTTFTAPSQPTESTITVRLTATYVDLGGQLVPSNRDTDEVLIHVEADPTLAGTDDTTAEETETPDSEAVTNEKVFDRNRP